MQTTGQAIIFKSAAAMIEAMFGPAPAPQHDAHVKALDDKHHADWLDAADARVRAAVVEINAEYRARQAARRGEFLQAAE